MCLEGVVRGLAEIAARGGKAAVRVGLGEQKCPELSDRPVSPTGHIGAARQASDRPPTVRTGTAARPTASGRAKKAGTWANEVDAVGAEGRTARNTAAASVLGRRASGLRLRHAGRNGVKGAAALHMAATADGCKGGVVGGRHRLFLGRTGRRFYRRVLAAAIRAAVVFRVCALAGLGLKAAKACAASLPEFRYGRLPLRVGAGVGGGAAGVGMEAAGLAVSDAKRADRALSPAYKQTQACPDV